MQVTAFDYAMWLAGAVLHLSIWIIMAKRNLIRELPVFAAFVIWSLFSSITLFIIHRVGGYDPFFYGFWLKQGVVNVLIFGVMYELYDHVFRNYRALQRLGTILFWWAAAVLMVIAIVMAMSAPGSDTHRIVSGLVILERSVRVVQVGLLLFIIVFTSYFKLSWRHYIFGLALGFGVYAGVQLIAVSLRAQLGESANLLWGKASVVAYALGAVVWTRYLSAPERTVIRLGAPQKEELEKWNQALAQLLYR